MNLKFKEPEKEKKKGSFLGKYQKMVYFQKNEETKPYPFPLLKLNEHKIIIGSKTKKQHFDIYLGYNSSQE